MAKNKMPITEKNDKTISAIKAPPKTVYARVKKMTKLAKPILSLLYGKVRIT